MNTNQHASTVTIKTELLRSARLGPACGAPPLLATRGVQKRTREHSFDSEGVFVGYGQIPGILPYLPQDDYDRTLEWLPYRVAIVENEALRAEFLPELGGRLWRLTDKKSGKNLLYTNDAIRFCNLAERSAWFSGGVEWNAGIVGHSPFTCSPLHTAVLEQTVNGQRMQVLRMYEYGRIRRICYQMDFYIPPDGRFLHCRMRITNLRSRQIPMYWWSNIAVPQAAENRVIVPARAAYVYLNGTLQKPPMPYLRGQDVSYPVRTPVARDYFYDLDPQKPHYVCYAQTDAPALLQASTSRLCGRKLFVWGQSQGGGHWQEHLTEHGGKYCEIQAGILKTQYGCVPMRPNAVWEWIELYGAMNDDNGRLRGDFDDADAAVCETLQQTPEYVGLEQELLETRSLACSRAEKRMDGSCFGWLEERRQLQEVGEHFLPEHLDFRPLSSENAPDLQRAAAPWLAVLDNQPTLPVDPQQPPESYMADDAWRKLLEQYARRNGASWWTGLQLGTMAAARRDWSKAKRFLEQSVQLMPTPWALTALAEVCFQKNLREDACRHALRALRMHPEQPGLRRGLLSLLLSCGAYREVAELAQGSDARCSFLRAKALFALGQTDAAEEILMQDGGLVIPDIREGDTGVTDLWYAIQRAKGIPDADSLEAPYKLDFRMHDETDLPVTADS